MKNNRYKTILFVVFLCYIFLTIGSLIVLVLAMRYQWFDIKREVWLNALFSWISAMSTLLLGLIAYWQNERFKAENDIATQKSDIKSAQHNRELLEINNRLMQLEENKEKAFLTFVQTIIQIYDETTSFSLEEKPYLAGFSNNDYPGKGSSIFVFRLVNLTDVPIRSIEIHDLKISYCDFSTEASTVIAKFDKGGFIPSPVTQRNKEFVCAFSIPGTKDITKNLAPENEIVLAMTLSSNSIFDRETKQNFLLRLQRKNPCFHAPDEHSFSLYCFESSAK